MEFARKVDLTGILKMRQCRLSISETISYLQLLEIVPLLKIRIKSLKSSVEGFGY